MMQESSMFKELSAPRAPEPDFDVCFSRQGVVINPPRAYRGTWRRFLRAPLLTFLIVFSIVFHPVVCFFPGLLDWIDRKLR